MKARAENGLATPPESGDSPEAALRGFIESLRARGAALTLRRYETACEHLLRECAGKTLQSLTVRDVQSTLSKLHARGMQPRSLATTLSAWRAWFRYLSKSDPAYSLDVFNGIRAPRAAKRLPNAMTEVEAVQLLDDEGDAAAARANPATLARDQAMFELLYGCGMRVGELVALEVSDVMAGSGEVRVFGKGRKERVLPLGGAAERALSVWLAERGSMLKRSAVSGETALFLGARGGRIDATVVRRVLRIRAQSAGVASHVHPHRLRHSFASHLLQASGDLRAVQELMGHASIASTQVYTHLDFAHLAKVYDGAHPRARKRKA